MSEKTTTHEFKDVKSNLLVLTAETALLKAIPIEDADTIDVKLIITEKKADIPK